jgi:alcohol dehydrogenase (NADP+)
MLLQITRIAAECGKSVAQTILSWNVLRGVSVIPKTARESRLEENLGLFRLNNEHFDRISSLSRETGPIRYLDPQDYIGFDIFDELEDQPVERSIA